MTAAKEGCRFIVGDPCPRDQKGRRVPVRYCDAPRLPGKAYCAECWQRTRIKPQTLAKMPPRVR